MQEEHLFNPQSIDVNNKCRYKILSVEFNVIDIIFCNSFSIFVMFIFSIFPILSNPSSYMIMWLSGYFLIAQIFINFKEFKTIIQKSAIFIRKLK